MLVKADDLVESGEIIQTLFAFEYPEGLELREMLASEKGWVRRAGERLLLKKEVSSDAG